MSTSDRKYNNLLLELKYLYAKIDYSDEVYEQAKRSFEEYATAFCEEHDIDIEGTLLPNTDTTDLDIQHEELYNTSELKREEVSNFCKNLFKKIAVRAHPDKLTSLSDDEKERKSELFKKARKALSLNQWYVLVQVAQELKIDLPEPDEEQVKLLIKESESVKETINNIEGTYAWTFYNQEDKAKRKLLMIMYLKNFGIDLTKDHNLF